MYENKKIKKKRSKCEWKEERISTTKKDSNESSKSRNSSKDSNSSIHSKNHSSIKEDSALNEIDQIFSLKKDKKLAPSKEETSIKFSSKTEDIRGSAQSKRSFTDDGFPIYSASELQVGLGGDTEDCPFDCSCCF